MTSRIANVLHLLGRRLRGEEGLTMIVVLGVMLVTSLIVVAVFTSANGEVHLTATSLAQKKAYYAAEAGIQDYEYHLTQDGNYLAYCTEPSPKNEALNQYYKTPAGTEPQAPSELHTVELPEVERASSEERYAIELIPAASDTIANDKQCDPRHLVETMVEEKGAATGTFRIKSVGFSGKAIAEIVATFRNANFVSYVWYTVYEVADPVIMGAPPRRQPSYWSDCAHYYTEREELPEKQCYNLNNFFSNGESINGPMHVEDQVGVCGEPTFGRTATDKIEFGDGNKRQEAGASGYSSEGCGNAARPVFKGTHILPNVVPSMPPPPGDEELKHIVEPSYSFVGKTEIVLENGSMTIKEFYDAATKSAEVKVRSGVPFPASGVIYVSNVPGGYCPTYSPFGPVPSYTEDTECGNVYVRGRYTESLTIASENDVVINGNILTPTSPEDTANATPTTNALLGLIANNFIRIYHPLSGEREPEMGGCGESTNLTKANITKRDVEMGVKPDLEEPIIYAAMLAVKQAIMVDNFDCGEPNLGHLNVYGTLAGLFSNGMTGVIVPSWGGPRTVHGYSYRAEYDNRLQAEEPPHFLNPIQAAWYIQRQTLAKAP
ncbi:MAG: pilus assembly PilX family protein [Solirubrobacteraceae bacterium]